MINSDTLKISSETATLPAEVIEAYSPGGIMDCETIGGGMINKTYLITTSDRSENPKLIVQQMGDQFSDQSIADLAKITQCIRLFGGVAPIAVSTTNGEPFIVDACGKRWRAMTFLDNEQPPIKKRHEFYRRHGIVLANFHNALAQFNFEPSDTIPHFHETNYYADSLRACLNKFTKPEHELLAVKLLSAYEALTLPPTNQTQLIHGDARTNNFIYRCGLPYALIDLDTIMVGSVWIDIGDLARDISEQNRDHMDIDFIREMAKGYWQTQSQDMTEQAFVDTAILSMRWISLELAIRFMVDVVEGVYFLWDASQFDSHEREMFTRANWQWNTYNLGSNAKTDSRV